MRGHKTSTQAVSLNARAMHGKALFESRCASCHSVEQRAAPLLEAARGVARKRLLVFLEGHGHSSSAETSQLLTSSLRQCPERDRDDAQSMDVSTWTICKHGQRQPMARAKLVVKSAARLTDGEWSSHFRSRRALRAGAVAAEVVCPRALVRRPSPLSPPQLALLARLRPY